MPAVKRVPTLLATIALVASACQSSTPSTAPAATGSQPTAPAGGSSAPLTPQPSTPATGTIPAWAQFGDAVELPTTSQWGTRVFANADGSRVVAPGRRVSNPGSSSTSAPRLAFRNADGTWTDTAFTVDKGIDQPSGYPNDATGIRVNGLAFGSSGMVAIGTSLFQTASHDPTYRSAAWFSTDGTSWQRTNFSDAAEAAELLALAVAAVDGGFIAVGSTSNAKSTSPATLVVLGSADGRQWSRRAEISGMWALNAFAITELGDRLVIVGQEYTCNDAGAAFGKEYQGAQLRLWSSTDAGMTWQATDIDAAGLRASKPLPTSLTECPDSTAADYKTQLFRDYATPGSYLGVAGGRIVLASRDEQTIITSTDLTTWSTGTLPGGVPVGGRPQGSDYLVRAVVGDADGLALISLEAPRKADDSASPALKMQPIIWRSSDGATWTRVDAKPESVEIDSTSVSLTYEPWGELLLVTFSPSPIDTTGSTGWTHVRSAGGP